MKYPACAYQTDARLRAKQLFSRFLHDIYDGHPEEFLSDEAYQAFRDAYQRILPSPWIDLETLRKNLTQIVMP